jgi:CRISPR-associated protein Csm3
MTTFPRLISKFRIKGRIVLRSGLHIGGGDVGLAIGGADKVVVRNPQDGCPYVPGSSLKGKLRALLEKAGMTKSPLPVKTGQDKDGKPTFEVKPCQCGNRGCAVCQVFGVSAAERDGTEIGEDGALTKWSGVGRLRVRDCHLTKLSADDMKSWRYLDMPYTEVKTEVAIDRLTSKANPRNFERVPAGAEFDMELVLDCFEGDDADKFLDALKTALELLEHDYLGGQGTRGYGAVRVIVDSVAGLDVNGLVAGAMTEWKQEDPRGLTTRFAQPAPEAAR